MQAPDSGAHLDYVNVRQASHRSQDCRPAFFLRGGENRSFGKAQDHTKRKNALESVLFSYQRNIKGPVNIYQKLKVRRALFCFVLLPYLDTENLCSRSTKKTPAFTEGK